MFENNSKKSDLVDYICSLMISLATIEKVIDDELVGGGVVLNENRILRTESLKFDIEDAFQTLYAKDPSCASQLSEGHDLLKAMFKRLDEVKYSITGRVISNQSYIEAVDPPHGGVDFLEIF